jgi:hypothetical protein
MTRTFALALFLPLLAACAPEGAENAARTADAPSADVFSETRAELEEARLTVESFHRALAQGDSAAALDLLNPDVVIYESGHAETLEEYRAGHLAADIQFAAATEREVLSEQTVPLGAHVLYLAQTRVHGTIGNREIDSHGVESMVLVPDGDRWLIRHIHWSN